MKSVAILPLRSGSKSILRKNFKKLLGRPLYQWILGEAIRSKLDKIYVFSDDIEVKNFIKREYHWTEKVKFIERSKESSTDQASTEYCMEELANELNFDFDIYCLLQATSPTTTYRDINNAIAPLKQGAADSTFTAVRDKSFYWTEDGKSLNYDYLDRPRRQDFTGTLVENGAVYMITKEMYKQTLNRLGGRISIIEMDRDSLFEIDEPMDWVVAEQIILNRLKSKKTRNAGIKTLVLDVDGVFTEGNVLTGANGELAKSFSFRDGMGFELAKESGIDLIVITSENSEIVHARMKKLGIDHYYPGVKDKFALLCHLCDNNHFQRKFMAYVGDDIGDIANMLGVNWSFAPSNAVNIAKHNSDIILSSPGGNMAIRETVEYIIEYNKRI